MTPTSGHLHVVDSCSEAEQLRDQMLQLLGTGVGDHTPIEIQEKVARLARRLVEIEPSVSVRAQ